MKYSNCTIKSQKKPLPTEFSLFPYNDGKKDAKSLPIRFFFTYFAWKIGFASNFYPYVISHITPITRLLWMRCM